MKSQIIMLLVFIIGISACKKDNNATVTEEENKTVLLRSGAGAVMPDNHNNAYDSIGYWHNEIVAYVQECKQPCCTLSSAVNSCTSDRPTPVDLSKIHFRRLCLSQHSSANCVEAFNWQDPPPLSNNSPQSKPDP